MVTPRNPVNVSKALESGLWTIAREIKRFEAKSKNPDGLNASETEQLISYVKTMAHLKPAAEAAVEAHNNTGRATALTDSELAAMLAEELNRPLPTKVGNVLIRRDDEGEAEGEADEDEDAQ